MIQQFRLGAVFSQSLSVLFANFIPFLLITLLVNIPTFAYGIYWFNDLQSMVQAEDVDVAIVNRTVLTGSVILGLLSIFVTPLATGAVTFGAFQYMRGQQASVGECISVGISKMLPVLGVALLAGLAMVGGFLLLIIPGFIVMCMLYVAVPAAVVEGVGVRAALGRSAFLTRGARWPIFGLIFIMGIIDNVLDKIVELALADMTYLIVMLLVGVMVSAWQASAAAVSYYHLRSVKESVEIDDIASVFD